MMLSIIISPMAGTANSFNTHVPSAPRIKLGYAASTLCSWVWSCDSVLGNKMWTEVVRATTTPGPSKPSMQYSFLYPHSIWGGREWTPWWIKKPKVKITKFLAAWISNHLFGTDQEDPPHLPGISLDFHLRKK